MSAQESTRKRDFKVGKFVTKTLKVTTKIKITNVLKINSKKYPRTNVLKYSFFHRIADQWNQLPLDIRVSDNVNIFKSRVKKFFSDF